MSGDERRQEVGQKLDSGMSQTLTGESITAGRDIIVTQNKDSRSLIGSLINWSWVLTRRTWIRFFRRNRSAKYSLPSCLVLLSALVLKLSHPSDSAEATWPTYRKPDTLWETTEIFVGGGAGKDPIEGADILVDAKRIATTESSGLAHVLEHECENISGELKCGVREITLGRAEKVEVVAFGYDKYLSEPKSSSEVCRFQELPRCWEVTLTPNKSIFLELEHDTYLAPEWSAFQDEVKKALAERGYRVVAALPASVRLSIELRMVRGPESKECEIKGSYQIDNTDPREIHDWAPPRPGRLDPLRSHRPLPDSACKYVFRAVVSDILAGIT